MSIGRALLLIRHGTTRSAIARLLETAGWAVECPTALDALQQRVPGCPARTVALVDWSLLNGLLLEAHRAEFDALCAQVPLVLVVPQNWLRFLDPQQTAPAVLLPKPFEVGELFQALEQAQTARADYTAGLPAPEPVLAPAGAGVDRLEWSR